METKDAKKSPSHLLTLAAIGVVYGDIGTSPLYAFKECFHSHTGLAPAPESIFGVLSLMFWSMALIVSVKYVTFILRVDHKGEGGILALIALLIESSKTLSPRVLSGLTLMGVFGAALFYGDGMITPAISVLSAVEGLQYATPTLQPYVIPLTMLILIGLFSFQKVGTGRVGGTFGPIMVLWFATLTILGLVQIIQAPHVLISLNPWFGFQFLYTNGYQGVLVLGSVFLAVTGAEALYADLGHFGRKPVLWGWYGLVFPALTINYFGQGALLLREPSLMHNPFYGTAPSWAIFPLVGLATAATVIASQALISGAFSITLQAIQLGFIPRLGVKHTSASERGQIYMPVVNWGLLVACLALVLGFRSSSALAAAYGVAVTLEMLLTTVLFAFVVRSVRGWRWISVLSLCSLFFVVEFSFFFANSLKIPHGGWFALVVATAVFTTMRIWKNGRRVLFERLKPALLPLDAFLEDVRANPPQRVKGCAVFLSSTSGATPLALLHNLKHNKIVHEKVIILTVRIEQKPYTEPPERLGVEPLGEGFYKVTITYGYMEEPIVPTLVRRLKEFGIHADEQNTTYFLSRETLVPCSLPGIPRWQRPIFAFLSRNATSPSQYFKLPASRVVEFGLQIEF